MPKTNAGVGIGAKVGRTSPRSRRRPRYRFLGVHCRSARPPLLSGVVMPLRQACFMKQTEKQRLTGITRKAVERIAGGHPQIKAYAEKAATKFSPTNAKTYRELSEIVWWLIAADAGEDAMALLDALCEVEDEYYWMFDALASSFATRAWLHSKQKDAAAART